MIVLADTNILLDVIQDRKPFSDSAAHVWKLVETGELVGYVSAISFNNVFYVERKNVGFDKALAEIKAIHAVFRTVPLDDPVIDRALGQENCKALRSTEFIPWPCPS